jgi:cytochrome c oxidase subunit II
MISFEEEGDVEMKASLKVLFAVAVMVFAVAGLSSQSAKSPKRIEIVASKYSFTPNEITLKKGEPVVLVLSSEDVTHGLKVKELDIKVEVKKGHPVEIPITPAQVGHFEGKCAHFCGVGHGSMKLEINVVE